MVKKKTIIGGLAIILLVAGIVVWKKLPDPGIKRLSHHVFPALIQGNNQIIWDNSTEDFRRLIVKDYGSKEAFGKMLEQASQDYRNVTSWEIARVLDFDDSATVQIEMKYKDKVNTHSYYLYLKKEEGVWKLNRPRVMDH
jgi:hypothetical protein